MNKEKNNGKQNQKPQATPTGGKLQFAEHTFGGKKAAPVTPERLAELRQFHAELIDDAEDGSKIYPTKTAFVVAASKAGYSTREIAAVLEMKPAVVYSMIWRVKSGYKAPRKPTVADDAAETDASEEAPTEEGGEELLDGEL